MSVIGSNILAGASGQGGGYNLTRSLRLRSSASAYLNRTPASAGNRKTWTYSDWIKRGVLGTYETVISARSGDSEHTTLLFWNDDTLVFRVEAGGTIYDLKTTQVFRDPSAYYHVMVVVDTTQATSSNREKIYINGVQVTSFSTANYVPQNGDTYINSTVAHRIGAFYASVNHYDGLMTEVNLIDGQALTPSSFGETSTTTGVWQPKKYTGTYGTNGFYLPFTDNSALTTSSNVGLGKDFSGNGNYWTTNNISITSGATYDSMTDVPTLTSATASNFAVMNPLSSRSGAGTALSNANLTQSGTSDKIFAGTIASTSGKFYYEYIVEGTTGAPTIGVADVNTYNMTSTPGETADSWGVWLQTGDTRNNATGGYSIGGFSIGNILQIAWDVDSGKIWFGKNNTWGNSGNPATDTNPAFTNLTGKNISPVLKQYASGSFNFGQRPFAYTPPTGFVALNTFNLPTPTIGATASSQANKYMDATLWTGDGTSDVTVVNAAGFAPDLVWYKDRTTANTWHQLVDIVRGNNLALASNETDIEYNILNNGYTGRKVVLNSNGFTVNDNYHAPSGDAMVGWQWKANGTGVTNTAGSITSTVSANTTSGFSVVTYTGNGTGGATVGHGLGVAPKMLIVKNRVQGTYGNWNVWHTAITGSQYLSLNLTDAVSTNNNRWNGTTPTSTVFSLGADSFGNTNKSGDTYVAYVFSEVAGFSKFGSYTGNGSSDGPMIVTGFRPKFVMIRRTDSSASWIIQDTARSTYNAVDAHLIPNASNAESTGLLIDYLSNGFKVRVSGVYTDYNANGGTFVYAAFAEVPQKYALAR